MAITLSNKVAPEQYTPIREKDSENPTTFKLKPLDGFEYLEVIGHASADGGKLTSEGIKLCLKYGLQDATNLQDGKTKKVKLDPKRLDPLLLAELAGRIMDISHIGEDERKN